MMCENTAVKIAIMVLEVVLVGVIDLLAFVPMLTALFRKWPYFHRNVVSDIPGNPHAFDNSVISLFRTFPEPSNFNIVWTALPLEDPLIVRGELPTSRINSLSLYPAAKTDPPSSIDLHKIELQENNRFEVTITSDSEKLKQKNTLTSNNWSRGMLAMRNYLVPPGEAVNVPEIVNAKTGKIVRATAQLVAGPATLDLRQSNQHKGIIRFLYVNTILTVLNLGILRCMCWKSNLLVVALGLLVSGILYKMCFLAGKKGLKKLTTPMCPQKNQLYLSSLEEGAKTSQPSRLHKYWVMQYDMTTADGSIGELSVRGRINRTYQKYWSLVVYDEYGLPLPHYIYDATVNAVTTGGSNSNKDEYSYDIRLRSGVPATPFKRKGLTDINVGKDTKGYVMFRLVHPMDDDEKACKFSQPEVKLLPNEGKKAK